MSPFQSVGRRDLSIGRVFPVPMSARDSKKTLDVIKATKEWTLGKP